MEKIIINNLKASGTMTAAEHRDAFGNALILLNTNGEVLIKDAVFDEPCYNAIEIGSSTAPSKVTIKNCDFAGKLSNNAISIFATQDNAVITVEDCHFADLSNALRLSNRTNASGVKVYIKNCTVDKWESYAAYSGFLLLQDYTTPTIEEFIDKSPFAPDKIEVHFQNLVHAGEVVTVTDLAEAFGSKDAAKQIGYMCIDCGSGDDRLPAYDQDMYPAISFE